MVHKDKASEPLERARERERERESAREREREREHLDVIIRVLKKNAHTR